ncbi:MAG: transcription termination/antitermination protein NusG [Leptospirales bacterium]|nr:transcription termination/antitermination protein NusG [Leptospirales bacterium]
MAALKWYVVRTYSGHENKVKTSIEKLVQNRNLQGRIGQVSIPTIKVAEMKNGKKRVVEKKFMPGYLLAEMAMDDELQYLILRLPSVAGFVGSPDPEPLSEDEVRNLMQGEASMEEETPAHARILFSVGERVKIVDGPFANFTGTVDEIMPDKGRLRVKVEIFGQATPVELDYLQVASNVG